MPTTVSATARVSVGLGARSYDVLIGSGIVDDPLAWQGLTLDRDALIVSNEVVAPLHLARLRTQVARRHAAVHQVLLPDGERHKDWTTLQKIFDALLQAGCDRHTVIYALGGGVVGDMAGFAAACYMRGVSCIQVPTTLLAQVDSSVGGKTAINHPLGKNMIGAFHQPLRVLCDIDHLATLPEREFRSGLAEVIKYGPIADREFFEWLEARLDSLLAREPTALVQAIKRSCEIKAAIVGRDEREGGLRAILNFGHTFGHAIEAGTGYGTWLHGEAVACGMALASELSARVGLIGDDLARRVRHLLRRCGLPCDPPRLGAARFFELMRLDKKSRSGQVRFVLLDALGHAVVQPASEAIVGELLGDRSPPSAVV